MLNISRVVQVDDVYGWSVSDIGGTKYQGKTYLTCVKSVTDWQGHVL